MKHISVYVENVIYEKLKTRSLEDAIKNGSNPSLNAVVNNAIISYLKNDTDIKEDPPTNPSSVPTSEQQSEPSSEPRNPFNFDNI
jgi:hypothetical protein